MYRIRMITFNSLPEVGPDKHEIEHVFNLGDMVQWESCGTVKRGEVVAIVPPGEYPPTLEELPGFSFKSYGFGQPRKTTSYLIGVTVCRSKIRRLYWPTVSWLVKL